MNIFYRTLSIFTISILLLSCTDDESLEKIPDGSIVIGKFLLTGTAESGPYKSALEKIDRFIADEFLQISAWTIVESERKKETLDEAGGVSSQPTQTEAFVNQQKEKPVVQQVGENLSFFFGENDENDDKLDSPTFGKNTHVVFGQLKNDFFSNNTNTLAPKIIVDDYPSADFLLIGQMDGFDFDIDRQTNLVKGLNGQEIAATLKSRTYTAQSTVSLRLIKIDNREIVAAKRIFFRDRIESTGNMESQINEVLQKIAYRIVAETLLTLAGDIQVAAINPDGTLLLNRGRESGLKPEMIMDLQRQGEWVKDPVTGDKLAKSSHKIGFLVIKSVTDNTSIAIYKGDDIPGVKDLAIFDNSQFDKKDKGFQPIRVAIASVEFSDISPKSPDKEQKISLVYEMMQGLAQQLNGKLGIKIVDQYKKHLKPILIQQAISNLNQGRDPGLPLGSLRGVDYVVFMSVVRSELTLPETEKVYLEVLGKEVDKVKPGKGQIKAYVYLQDVNTAETAARTEVRLTKEFKEQLTEAKAWSELTEELLLKVNKSLLSQLRPLQILSNANNKIMLNHGKDVLKIGDTLTVYGKGETIIDPYTGERLTNVGSVDIAHLNVIGFQAGGYAYAELSSGIIPSAGMSVSIDEKDSCQNNADCDDQVNSSNSLSVVPKKQEVHQYNW